MEKPYYTHHVFCCTNERPEGHKRGSCKQKGAEALRNYMKARAKEEGMDDIRINTAGCLDRCELGPVFVIYPEGIWYSVETHADADEIIQSHLKNGVPVERLRLKNDQTAKP
jgi:(2Fe-2S) ferredoxin